jgi:type II secretory pathway component PulF
VPSLIGASADLIEQGLNAAQDENLIQKNSSLWKRLQEVITAVREGQLIDEAMAEAGVSRELVARLVEMGERSPFPAAELSL